MAEAIDQRLVVLRISHRAARAYNLTRKVQERLHNEDYNRADTIADLLGEILDDIDQLAAERAGSTQD